MSEYTHLSYQERAKLNMGLLGQVGTLRRLGVRAMAASISRDPSTVSRELRRNGGPVSYHPELAERKANERQQVRTGITKIGKNPDLQAYIREKLKMKWSPKVIAAKWNQSNAITTSGEAIYQWIYSDDTKKEKLWLLLCRRKRKRGIRRSRPAKQTATKVHITKRPATAEDRSEVGHCEVDLVFCRGSQSVNLLTCIDRKTRHVAIIKNESKRAEVIEDAIKNKLPERLPFSMLSMTLDNGTEFASHDSYQVAAYFCDPHSPWQKGSIENFNGQLRSYIPFMESLDLVSQEQLDQIADHINNIPRQILGFLSPIELINQLFNQNNLGVALMA
jgi:IS30 family transposase